MATVQKQSDQREEGVLPPLLPPPPPLLVQMRTMKPEQVTSLVWQQLSALLSEQQAECEKVKANLRSHRFQNEHFEAGLALFDLYKQWIEEIQAFLKACPEAQEKVD